VLFGEWLSTFLRPSGPLKHRNHYPVTKYDMPEGLSQKFIKMNGIKLTVLPS
jgi:hypothetical protein